MIRKIWQELLRFIQEINTTNTRILASIILATIIVLSTLVMMFLEIKINDMVLGILCAFVATLGGLDVIQFTQKRKTYLPETIALNNITTTATGRALGTEYGVEYTP